MTARETPLGERFAGHVGLLARGCSTSMWAPISADTRSQVRKRLLSNKGGFALVETMSNRLLAFDPKQMKMITSLDDADEWPEGDARIEGPLQDYAGIPLEVYQRMSKWAEDRDEFESMNSAAKRKEAMDFIVSGRFLDRPAALHAFLHHTVIHFHDGTSLSYEARRENIYELLEIEDDPSVTVVEISAAEGPERFFPLDMVRMIEIPLIELEAARLELFGED